MSVNWANIKSVVLSPTKAGLSSRPLTFWHLAPPTLAHIGHSLPPTAHMGVPDRTRVPAKILALRLACNYGRPTCHLVTPSLHGQTSIYSRAWYSTMYPSKGQEKPHSIVDYFTLRYLLTTPRSTSHTSPGTVSHRIDTSPYHDSWHSPYTPPLSRLPSFKVYRWMMPLSPPSTGGTCLQSFSEVSPKLGSLLSRGLAWRGLYTTHQ